MWGHLAPVSFSDSLTIVSTQLTLSNPPKNHSTKSRSTIALWTSSTVLFSYNGLEWFITQWKRTCGDRLVKEVFGESEEVWYLWVDICSMTIWWVLGVLKVPCSSSWAFSITPFTGRAITISTLASEEVRNLVPFKTDQAIWDYTCKVIPWSYHGNLTLGERAKYGKHGMCV